MVALQGTWTSQRYFMNLLVMQHHFREHAVFSSSISTLTFFSLCIRRRHIVWEKHHRVKALAIQLSTDQRKTYYLCHFKSETVVTVHNLYREEGTRRHYGTLDVKYVSAIDTNTQCVYTWQKNSTVYANFKRRMGSCNNMASWRKFTPQE